MKPKKSVNTGRSRHRTSPRNPVHVAKMVSLYPRDVEKLGRLARGEERLDSLVIRHLIRHCSQISREDLLATAAQDRLTRCILRRLSPLTPLRIADEG